MKSKGFTFIELMITVAIVALLASIALPLAEVTVQRNKEKDFRHALREIREAIDSYKHAADEGAIERKADASGYPETLAVLVEGVADKRKTDGTKLYFLRRVPADPLSGEEWGLRSYASPATEPQPGKDVFDVYSRSQENGLNGTPYREW
ncbi:MAG: type II secretion system protein [Betaproteobacteria bacterium]|nr:MAG: type II secretion system protein [Betaproteobacteria bacterium]